MTKCDEIEIIMNISSTKKANTVATNVTSAASTTNYHRKKT